MSLTKQLAAASVALGVTLAGTAGSMGTAGARTSHASVWGPVANLSREAPSWSLLPTSVAVDSDGNTLALWVHPRESRRAVTAAYRPVGHGWTGRVPVPGSRRAEAARVAFDGAGEAVVVWAAGHRVGAVRRAPGGSWGRPVTVFRDPRTERETLAGGFGLDVNDRGRAVLSFSSRRGLEVVIGFSDGRWGRPWTPPTRGAGGSLAASRVASPTSSGPAEVVIDRWGRATAVWTQGGWVMRAMTAYRDPGRRWSRPKALTGLEWEPRPQLAVRQDGQVAVLLQTEVRGRLGIRVVRKSRTGDWVRGAHLAYGMNTWKLRMGMDDSGRVIAAWATGRGAFWVAENSPGKGWTRKARVSERHRLGDDYWLAVNASGQALLGWTSRPGRRAVQAVYRSRDGSWDAPPRTVSHGPGESRGPALAIGPGGAAVMVWAFQPRGSSLCRIQASRFTP